MEKEIGLIFEISENLKYGMAYKGVLFRSFFSL